MNIYAISHSHNLLPDLFDLLFDKCSLQRQQKATRYLHREDACRSVVAESLAKLAIAHFSKTPPQNISFVYKEFEKPFVANMPEINFNISHSHEWVLCIVDKDIVGIDIEFMHKENLDIAKQFFHPCEYEQLLSLPIVEQRERFFELWTLKESYIKAIGKGLTCPLNGFAITFTEHGTCMTPDKSMAPLHFKQYSIDPNYKCAVCSSNPQFPEQITFITPLQLLEALK